MPREKIHIAKNIYIKTNKKLKPGNHWKRNAQNLKICIKEDLRTTHLNLNLFILKHLIDKRLLDSLINFLLSKHSHHYLFLWKFLLKFTINRTWTPFLLIHLIKTSRMLGLSKGPYSWLWHQKFSLQLRFKIFFNL